jgi:hypothetical protein
LYYYNEFWVFSAEQWAESRQTRTKSHIRATDRDGGTMVATERIGELQRPEMTATAQWTDRKSSRYLPDESADPVAVGVFWRVMASRKFALHTLDGPVSRSYPHNGTARRAAGCSIEWLGD